METCKFRRGVRCEDGTELSACKLVKVLLDCHDDRWSRVRRDACEACCQSFPPSEENLNPVVASLLYDASKRILAAAPAGLDLKRIKEAGQTAARSLHLVYREHPEPIVPRRAASRTLLQLVPRPRVRRGREVRRWAVGVTTAPRREPTLEVCLGSLIRSGWEKPYLFVDSAVRISQPFLDVPGTFRDRRTGAWPNYYLALMELLMRQPYADAYMIVQDDVIFFDRESLREYLQEVLWPGRFTGLVSLFSPKLDPPPKPGWHCSRRAWRAGAHALVFPPQVAKAFVLDRAVFEHRWAADPAWACCIDDVIHNWVKAHRLGVSFPVPSLAQHIGDSSTLWPNARAQGSRRADPFAGDLE